MGTYQRLLAQYPPFERIKQAAQHLGVDCYVVGGFVRDALLKRPSKDIDIVCVGSGVELAKAFAHAVGSKRVHVFKNFGTAMVRWQNWEVEFVGARKESYERGSRKPFVETGSLQDDQRRRDFTINALAIGLCGDTFGTLIDPFDGIADLKAKVIRTPLAPDKTFSDDPLRMLRAIRFATQLSFELTEDVRKALCQEVMRIQIVSKERIMIEFNKILATPNPARGLLMLDEAGLLKEILPELEALKGRDRIGRHTHKDNFFHTLEVLSNLAEHSSNLWLRWAALLHDIAKPRTKGYDPRVGFTFHGHEDLGAKMVPSIFRRLRLPLNEKMHYVKKLVHLHLRPIALVEELVTDSAVRRLIYDAGDHFEDLMVLCRADITSKNDRRVQTYLANFDLVEEKVKAVLTKDHVRTLQPVLDGHMLMKMFSLPASKKVGLLKKEVKDAILAGKVANAHEPLYNYLIQIASKYHLKSVMPLSELLP